MHQRHHRRAPGGDGAHSGEGREAGADQRLHRRGQEPGRRGGAAARVHGGPRDRERAAPFPGRARAQGEPAVGRGQGPQTGADHAQHGPSHAPRDVRRLRQVVSPGGEGVRARARPVGAPGRPSRGGGADALRHGGAHLRHGGDRRPGRAAGRRGEIGHPARGGDRQAGLGEQPHLPRLLRRDPRQHPRSALRLPGSRRPRLPTLSGGCGRRRTSGTATRPGSCATRRSR